MTDATKIAETKITCNWCGREFDDPDEAGDPRYVDGQPICDSCYREEFLFTCCLCGEEDEQKYQHEMLVVAEECSHDLKRGLYRIIHRPYYMDGMIEGYFIPSSLKRIGPLPEGVDTSGYPAGHLCRDCQAAVDPRNKRKRPAMNSVEYFPPRPNKMFPPEITALLRFAHYKQPVPCAECGRKKAKHWTMLCPFTAGVEAGFTFVHGAIRQPGEPVCGDHPLAPAIPMELIGCGCLEIRNAPAEPRAAAEPKPAAESKPARKPRKKKP